MPESASEGCLGPPELEREQAQPDRDERDPRPRQHEQRETAEQRREAAERKEDTHGERPAPMSRPPVAHPVRRGHATAAPTRSPSLRSR